MVCSTSEEVVHFLCLTPWVPDFGLHRRTFYLVLHYIPWCSFRVLMFCPTFHASETRSDVHGVCNILYSTGATCVRASGLPLASSGARCGFEVQ